MNPINELKSIQKQLASNIREDHKEWDSITFRHQHIAYCELRGKQRDEIERPAQDNKPDEQWIVNIKSEWEPKVQEWRERHA